MALISEHGLQEIADNLRRKDLIKAKLVLDHFPDFPYDEQYHIIEQLKKSEDSLALPLLVHIMACHEKAAAGHSSLPDIVLNKALQNPDILISEIQKPAKGQKLMMQLAIDLQFGDAVPALINVLQETEDKLIIITALYGLGILADPLAVDAVSEFLHAGDDSNLQKEAVNALGQIATRTAMQRLAESMGKNEEMDKKVIEVFAEVQDEIALQRLTMCLQSKRAHIRNYAKLKLTEIGAKAVPVLTGNLHNPDPDLQIHSLNVLQETNDTSAAQAIRKLLHSHPRISNVRFAAYEALANLPMRKGDYLLAAGLTDPEENVRLAAARAINSNLDQLLISGLKNMTGTADEESRKVVRAIIDAQAGDIFLALCEGTSFQEQAVTYLAEMAHPELRTWFVNYLIRFRKTGLANLILRQNKEEKKKFTGTVCVVDDSRMILNVYRSILTELGYEALLFQYPAEAIDWLATNKPDFVCTDLNMPQINGIDLIKSIRKKYSKKELPIVMVTTQNEVQDNNAAKKAGVSDIIYKPFNAETLGEVLNNPELGES